MKAKLINEAIKHLGPKSEKELEASYKNLSPNDKLITGVENDFAWLIELGLQEGGDQLWYECGGPMGAAKPLLFPSITNNLARIKKIVVKETNNLGFYKKATFNVIYEIVWNPSHHYGSSIGKKYQTQLFYRKYKPVDKEFIEKLDACQRNIQQIKNIL